MELYLSLDNIKNLNDENSCLSYINKTIIHKFCKLYKLSLKEEAIKSNSVTDNEFDISYQDLSFDDVIFHLDISSSLTNLTNKGAAVQQPFLAILKLLHL